MRRYRPTQDLYQADSQEILREDAACHPAPGFARHATAVVPANTVVGTERGHIGPGRLLDAWACELQGTRCDAAGVHGDRARPHRGVDIVLQVYNPNGYKLDALKMTYQVDVDSIKLGEGELDGRFVVPERDSSLVRLPVRFTYAGLGVAGRSLLNAGTVNYRVRGDFTVATPIGNFTRPYDRRGSYSSMAGGRR